ncbi:hypothetical protein QFC22_003462 [Naganishia vaughanmartiniae]|uniref:Uncharacterized protein n=1 Tax=Naganishia vaughanmartiniae TaxID=1424756 RepID=A0ACC2X777_9TREE|nr:hypothetical protein QFC22_003462 [Naganishia vaughanmartiniae]
MDEKSQLPPRAELSSGESTETASAGELTPIQESVELSATLPEQKFQMEDLTTPRPHDMDISSSSSDTGPYRSTPRRPSLSKGDSDEYSKKCRTMSTCSTGSMSGSGALGESRRLEAHRVKQFYEQNGFLCAPAQLPKDVKKRLRAIRRLGFDGHDTHSIRRETLDRYTRLLTSILKAKMSTVTILGADTQLFPSEVGLGIQKLDTDLGICTHTALSTERPLVVEDADKDWRFSNHPMVLSGVIKSYCGAPLRQGKTAAIIGTLCVIDDKPRPDFSTEAQKIVKELAACVSNELELLAQADEQKLAQKMHDRALKFSRHWLQSTSSSTRTISKHKSNGRTRKRKKQVNIVTTENGSEQDEQISVYDEACQYVADTIGASCTIIDTSSFHIAYPVSPVPPSPKHHQPSASGGKSWQPDTAEGGGVSEMVLSPVDEAPEGGSFQNNVPLEAMQPQVYHLPKRSNSVVEDTTKDASLRSVSFFVKFQSLYPRLEAHWLHALPALAFL